MSKEKVTPEDKDILAALEEIDKINPYASYLNNSSFSNVPGWIDTGSLGLNAIISGSLWGGIPKGRVTQLAGASQTGKSFFVLRILANAQKEGLQVVIFDTENAIDSDSAESAGLDTSKVKYVPCVSIEQTRNAIFKFLTAAREKGLLGKFIIAIDSLGNLQSELDFSRMEKDGTGSDMGSKARAMKSLLQTCVNLGALTQTTILVTNHIYDDPTALFPTLEKHMPGGRNAVFLPSVTVQIARKPMKDDGGKTTDSTLAVGQKSFPGVVLRALTVKNRFIKQYLEVEMYLSFSTGFNRLYGLLDLVVGFGIITQNGATYTLTENGKKLGYYKNFRKDKELWNNILLPALEEKIKVEWAYSNMTEEEDEDFIDSLDEESEEVEVTQENE